MQLNDIEAKVRVLEARYADRDHRARAVRLVRNGKLAQVFPEYFSDSLAIPVVANFIDVAARDLAEMIAPLPALNCASGTMVSERAKRFAERRKKIASHYWQCSNLGQQMFAAADNWLTYGFVPLSVEPDFKYKAPKLRFISSVGSYPEFDRDGECTSFTRKWMAKASVLASQYPMHAGELMGKRYRESDRDLTVVKYEDAAATVVYVRDLGLVLERFPNALGECPVLIARRPSLDDEIRGQFDDVIGVQAARALMMRLAVEAAEKQVQAPIAVPDDITEFNVGPNSLLYTSQPQNVRRVDLSVPGSTFAEAATLQQELLQGARTPQQRFGSQPGSIVTGRGVEALMGGFDSQVKTAQASFAECLRKATRLAFKWDEKLWPHEKRTIRGVIEGAPYEESYVPASDIAGDWVCDVTYGFLAGMDPNRALVFLLQLRGDKAIDRATLQRHMPFDVDLVQMQQNLDVEQLRDALMSGVLAYTQAIGPLAQQGQDPSVVLKVVSEAIAGRQKGKPLEELVTSAFEAVQQEAEQKKAEMMAQLQGGPGGVPGGGGGPGDQLPPGVQPSGLLQGVAPGQAGMAPGGRPSVQDLLASIGASGSANLQAGIKRRLPA